MARCEGVLVPYKITLLSNNSQYVVRNSDVLVPYKITRLLNGLCGNCAVLIVLVPYKITRLSNLKFSNESAFVGPLQNMKIGQKAYKGAKTVGKISKTAQIAVNCKAVFVITYRIRTVFQHYYIKSVHNHEFH